MPLTDFYAGRRRARAQVQPSFESLAAALKEARELLDHGRPGDAESRLRELVDAARADATLLARTRCLLSVAFEMQGRFRDSLEVVQAYESAEARAGLDDETAAAVRVQVGLGYSLTGDQPKAIALLNAAIQHESGRDNADARLGAVYVALARPYRMIAEYSIARDHARSALEHYRRTGDWRGMAEAYFALGLADLCEGDAEHALENFEQAVKLIGDRPAVHLLGKVYNNMAGACWMLKRPHEGIRHLEKAIGYYEHTDQKTNAAVGYNNLGLNLVLVGKWDRAHECLTRALELAFQVDEHNQQVPTILESLGELRMLRGDLEEARNLLERAVNQATEHGNKWYATQAMKTLARCHLAIGDHERALVVGEGALSIAKRIGDRQAIWESSVLLAEAYLEAGTLNECAALLSRVTEETAESAADLAVSGEAQRVHGMLALRQDDPTTAVNHFGRSLSIFEMLGDRYRVARAHYWLARAHVATSPQRAGEHAALALRTFRELGARLAVERAEELLNGLSVEAAPVAAEPPAVAQLLTLRLAEAVASRELLLRELAAVIHQETKARRVLIAEADEESRTMRVVTSHGFTPADAEQLAAALGGVETERERERFGREYGAAVYQLKASSALPALLFVAPAEQFALPGGAGLEPLLRVVELGLDVCALRERGRA
ncbi:MAG TPA: tetratricopeptide repeat protein, partial [Pyrinomonadaceae bacterium]|nr:tetratricopeptide repeat protein [Pyrinomonadaceae bacterium]